jgi:hypothetical protein
MKRSSLCLLSLTAAAGFVLAAPAPSETTETVKDRATFMPHQKYNPLPGKVIGVLVSDVAPFMSTDGRGGPPDAYAFSAGNASYRWLYVPKPEKKLIDNLQVHIGEKGDKTRVYPALGMASAVEVKRWEITVPYSLVEFEVNDGDGAPAEEGFVATKMKRIDDTKDFPLKVPDVVTDLRKRYQAHIKEHQKDLDDSLAEVQKTALGDKKLTGPRRTTEIFYITWLPESDHLRVAFRTTITDGAFTTVEGIGPGRGGPGGIDPGFFPGKDRPEFNQGLVAFPPPPPPRVKMTVGTEIGVEFGVAYEVNKSGKVDKVSVLPNKTFSNEIKGVELPRGGGIRELPPPPPPPQPPKPDGI